MSSTWPDLQDFDGAPFLGQEDNHRKLEHKVNLQGQRQAESERLQAQTERRTIQLEKEVKELRAVIEHLTTLLGSVLGGIDLLKLGSLGLR
ncbi:hypothetical protein MRS44_003896 [Fusarium solani]|uniref:uncharacterized protein n=1 Tax=Fusarium solani TaxID=169388 RepID=UPI0032C44491|nr:hypothetical protein MRS44_003896 [Fusarium solani]